MGKNKKSTLLPPPFSGTRPCSSKLESTSGKKPLHSIDVMDNSSKLLRHTSNENRHQNLGRPIFLKRGRHHYGRQYSRCGSADHPDASPSYSKGMTSLRDEKLMFKFATHYNYNSESSYQSGIREETICRPERIRCLVTESMPADALKMVCEICRKRLIQKLCIGGTTIEDLSDVAVLVCGHVFHADCLEQKTVVENRLEPPCPICLNLVSKQIKLK